MSHVAASSPTIHRTTARRCRITPRPRALVLTLMLLIAACGGSAVAATVGETEITAAEIEQAYSERTEASEVARALEGSEGDTVDEELRREVLTNLIRREILRLVAEEQGIEISEEDLADERAALVEQLGGQAELDELLAVNNVSEEQFRAELRDQAIQTKLGGLLRDDVTQSAVRAVFAGDPKQYGATVEVSHILTATRPAAQDVIERIDNGEDFADVARTASTDTASAQEGGNLGEIARGQAVPAFEAAAFAAGEGEIVGPVETEFGYHVLWVRDRTEARSFAEVEDEIRAQLEEDAADRAVGEYLTSVVDDLAVEVDQQYGRWDEGAIAVVSSSRPETPELPPRPPQSPAPSAAPTS
jgi:foldase protein PrsA